MGVLSGCATAAESDFGEEGAIESNTAALVPGQEIVINEVESNGGSPGDWVELMNGGAATIDVSGWFLRDDDNSHKYTLPANSKIPAGGYLVLEEAQFSFGLGAPDAARLYNASGTLIDSYSWSSHASTTYGRCPNGTGAMATTAASTKGLANTCKLTMESWPGSSSVVTSDGSKVFGENLSDLAYEPSQGVLWAVQNSPSKLFRLVRSGSQWVKSTTNGWGSGKTLVYTNGSGGPDSEGLTRGDLSGTSVYVAAERNNNSSGTSRNSVLRYDISGTSTTLTAAMEWNLTANLPSVDSNSGFEAITFVPDAALVAMGFADESTGGLYNPAGYAAHGGGVFFVGLEANGTVYGYVLNHSNSTYTRVATFSSGQAAVMALQYDADFGYLYAHCDDTCGNTATLLTVDAATGKYTARLGFNRPSGMSNINNEGIAIAPESACSGGLKRVVWTDDSATSGHSLRDGQIDCGPLY